MTPDERRLLEEMHRNNIHGSSVTEVFGNDKQVAKGMENKGWIVWRGTDYGVAMYKITAKGTELLTNA
jgi:hypothetical protein